MATAGWRCSRDDAEYHEDPFKPPLVGHNALRAYLLDASASQRDVEFTVERHWASGTTILAAWHVSFVRRATGNVVRMAGFLTAEMAADGRASRFRDGRARARHGRVGERRMMAGDQSFDVVSDFDEQELRNALDQVRREVGSGSTSRA